MLTIFILALCAETAFAGGAASNGLINFAPTMLSYKSDSSTEDNSPAEDTSEPSQNNNQGEASNQIDDIMEKAIQAYGDKEHIAAFANNAQFIGSISGPEDNWSKHAYKYIRKSPAWRMDIEGKGGDAGVVSTIFDGTGFWQVGEAGENTGAPTKTASKPDNKQNPAEEEDSGPPTAPAIKRPDTGPAIKGLSPEQARWYTDQADRQPFLLACWRSSSYHFQLLGESTYKHLPVYAVEVTTKNHTPTIIYLDRNNYLVCAIAFQSWQLVGDSDQLKKIMVVKEYAENRPALNSIWPYKETLFVDKKPASVCELSAISSADDVAVDYFRPGYAPAVGAGINTRPLSPLPQLSAPITVPFEYSQGEIVCRGKVAGMEPLWFLIDTGTSNTIIDRSVAAQCLLPRGNDFRVSTWQGNVVAQTTWLDKIEFGNLSINNINAQIADLSADSKQVGRSIAGIIGMDVLSHYLLTIDYAKPSLIFADPTTSRPADLVTIPFVSNKNVNETGKPPVPRIKVTLPGADSTAMLIDTGAAFNHLAASVAGKHLKEDINKAGHGHTIEGTGLDGRPVQLGLITLDPIIVGSYKIHRITFTYPQTSGSSALLQKESPASTAPVPANLKAASDDVLSNTLAVSGILGNPFFEHFIVILDCPFHRLLLKPNPAFETGYQLEEALAAGDTALFTKRDFRQSEFAYQKALSVANNTHNVLYQALCLGRLGNLRRLMAHDLHRPEHAQAAYQYFKQADQLAGQGNFKEAQGRILADWSLLYSENGQAVEGNQTIAKALQLAPKDAFVNVDYAVHLFRERSYAEAEKYIDKALFFDPENWQALWYQVKLSEMFLDTKKEKATLQEILQHYPWSKLAQTKLKTLETPAPSAGPIIGCCTCSKQRHSKNAVPTLKRRYSSEP